VQVLITNLDANEFNTEEISTLYKMRWGIETAFDTLKNKLTIENFTGTKPVLIEQDVYTSIYICNLASDLIADAQVSFDVSKIEELDDNSDVNPKKYPMSANILDIALPSVYTIHFYRLIKYFRLYHAFLHTKIDRQEKEHYQSPNQL